MTESTSFFSTYNESNKSREAARSVTNATLQEFVSLKKREEEDRVISMDTTNLPLAKRRYWEMHQTEILNARGCFNEENDDSVDSEENEDLADNED